MHGVRQLILAVSIGQFEAQKPSPELASGSVTPCAWECTSRTAPDVVIEAVAFGHTVSVSALSLNVFNDLSCWSDQSKQAISAYAEADTVFSLAITKCLSHLASIQHL